MQTFWKLVLGLGGALLLGGACSSQEKKVDSPAEETSTAEVAQVDPAEVVEPPPPPALADAAPPLLAEGEHLLDLDGDGTLERLKVSPSHVHFGESSTAFTLEKGRVVQPKTMVIDIDTSDDRKELLIQLDSYESLAYNVLVFMREGKLHLSRVLYVNALKAAGDGHLTAETWIQGKRFVHDFVIEGVKIVDRNSKKKR